MENYDHDHSEEDGLTMTMTITMTITMTLMITLRVSMKGSYQYDRKSIEGSVSTICKSCGYS